MIDAIQRYLTSYTPTTEPERHHATLCLDLTQTPSPTTRHQYEPGHFTVSAFVTDPDHAHILMIEHASLGLWLQPGGHLEQSDATLEAAARREVLEETGVIEMDRIGSSLFHVDIHDIPARPQRGEPSHRHYDLRLAFRARSRALTTSAEVLDARWVPLSALDTLRTDASVRRAAAHLVRLLEST